MKASCLICNKQLSDEFEEDMVFTCDGKCSDDYARGGCLPPGLNAYNQLWEKYDKLLMFVKNILTGKIGYFESIEQSAEDILKEIGELDGI